MPRRRLTMRSILVNGGALALMLLSGACSSSNKKGLPTNLPNIALNSSAATPAHNMASYDYPFDSSGNYVTSWAAEGERRSGRSAASYSNPGSSSRRTSSSSRSRYTSSTRPKTTTTTKKSSSSSSGSARVHKVKSGDTLYGLARRYGTTVAKIKAANGLRSDNIGVGRSLKIPR